MGSARGLGRAAGCGGGCRLPLGAGGRWGLPDFTPSSLPLQPCYLRDWELQVHFKIHGQGKKNLNGDGFAIWYTKDRMQPGERSGTLRAVPGAPGLPREPSVELQRCGVRGLLPLRAGRPKRE